MKLKILLLLITIGLLPLIAVAQDEKAVDSGVFSLYFENDLFTGTDRQYTNGVRLTWISSELKTSQKNSRLTRRIYSITKNFFFINKRKFKHFISISIGQNIYTPNDIKLSKPINEDRPYAGITYFGVGFNSQSNSTLHSLEFDVGIVGPQSGAEECQKIVHKIIGATHPNGWANQLKDELGLGITYDYKLKLLKSSINQNFGYDLIMHMGGSLGNVYTGAGSGVEMRFGWKLPRDFGVYFIRPCSSSLDSIGKYHSNFFHHQQFRIYFFGSVDGQAVLRNIFLDGNTFQNSPRVEKKPFTAKIMTGMTIYIRHFKVSSALVWQTKSFKTQRENHVYGSINLSYSY